MAAQGGAHGIGSPPSPLAAEQLVKIDIADFKVSARASDVLVTYALGSCIAVILHDPVRKAGGMIHYMLPSSQSSPERARAKPAMFADTGVPLLFEAMFGLGCKRENLCIKIAGAAKLYDDRGFFEIGRRNYAMVRQMFWKRGYGIAAEDVGGHASRTAKLWVATGRVTIRGQDGEVDL